MRDIGFVVLIAFCFIAIAPLASGHQLGRFIGAVQAGMLEAATALSTERTDQ